jgi:hypothetical protein
MPEPPSNPPDRITFTMQATETPDSAQFFLVVTRPEEIPAALAQGKPVLIDIPAFQWRASILATIQKWGGDFAWWLVKLLAGLLLTQWLLAQGLSVPDWAKFNFVRQPDNKVILSPHEE